MHPRKHLARRLRLPAFVLLTAVVPLTVAWHNPDRPAIARQETECSGRISGWKLEKDGSVYFRLEGETAKQQPFRLWFVTPPSQTATTEFERQVLLTVLELYREKGTADAPEVTVRGDDSNGKGRLPDDAIELVSMARL